VFPVLRVVRALSDGTVVGRALVVAAQRIVARRRIDWVLRGVDRGLEEGILMVYARGGLLGDEGMIGICEISTRAREL
jgi:hypothetical protein